MINSILMFGVTNQKFKKINIVLTILWLSNMFFKSNLKSDMTFIIINTLAFIAVFIAGKVIKGKYLNNVYSVLSILVWSALIDLVSYFMYPEFSTGQNVFTYVFNGMAFNYKYVLINLSVLVVLLLVEMIYSRVKNKVTKSIQN